MSEAISKLFARNAHIAGSLTERMGLPVAAKLASSMIMVRIHLTAIRKVYSFSLWENPFYNSIPSLWLATIVHQNAGMLVN